MELLEAHCISHVCFVGMLSHPLPSFSANAEYEIPAWFVQGHVPCRWRREADPAGCPTSSFTSLFHSACAHCWQNSPKHTFFWCWVSGFLCLPKERKHIWGRRKYNCQVGKEIKEQRMADLFYALNVAKSHIKMVPWTQETWEH